MKKILNTPQEDYHIHSLNFSDGMNTIDEIVKYAWDIWLKRIAITDHSQAVLDSNWIGARNRRSILPMRKNIHNNVEVIFGVEWDLLNEEWGCCFTINDNEPDLCILSCHLGYIGDDVYLWSLENITTAYINAVKKHHSKIFCLWHVCKKQTSKYLDVEALAKVLNEYNIPIEVNSTYLTAGKTDTDKLDKLLKLLDTWVYVNSDMHTFAHFDTRFFAFDYLKQRWYR